MKQNEKKHQTVLPKLLCHGCGYEWTPRIEQRPVKCPNCQSRKWDADKTINKKG